MNANAPRINRSIYIYLFFQDRLRFREYLPSSNKMSDPVVPAPAPAPASLSVEAVATGVVEAPAPVPAVAPVSAVDFGDHGALLKFALTKIVEAELQADVALDDKIKQVVDALKAEIRKADLSPSVRVAALDWCDDALPYVIKAVDMIQAELKKVAVTEMAKVQEVVVAEVRKCCPTFFTKKA
jgi:hypothetical protein